jgi:hypothetical protein
MQYARRVHCLIVAFVSVSYFCGCYFTSHATQVIDDDKRGADSTLREGEKVLADVKPDGETSRGSSEPSREEWLFAGNLTEESWERVTSELESRHIEFFIDSGTMPAIMVQAHDLDLARELVGNNTHTPK